MGLLPWPWDDWPALSQPDEEAPRSLIVRVRFLINCPSERPEDKVWVEFCLDAAYGFPSALAANLWITELAKSADPLELLGSGGNVWRFPRGSYSAFVTAPA